jgi:hypothetical protein
MYTTECDNLKKNNVGSAEMLNLKILLLVWDIYTVDG